MGFGEVNLVGDGSTVDLDLHQVGLLLLQRSLADLSVCDDTDNRAVLLDSLELLGDGLAVGLGVLGSVLGVSLLLGLVPVLVEASLDLVGEVLGPDGGQGSETARSLDVSDNTDNNHRRSLDDGNGLDDFLLVHLGSNTLEFTNDVGHTSLVAEEGCEVDWLLGIILETGEDQERFSSSTGV